MGNSYQILISKLDAFIRKYYKNKLLRGGIYSLTLLLIVFIVFTTIEYFGQFDVVGRTTLFYLFIVSIAYIFGNYIIIPLLKLYKFGKIINHNQAAEIIGSHFEEVKDKLLNLLQLEQLSKKTNNQLILASIDQKATELKPVPFTSAVNFNENKKYLKIIIIPILVIISVSFFAPNVFTESTERLVNHNVYISPSAPFSIKINNNNLSVLKNKDFILNVSVSGNQLPEKIYIETNGKKYPLSKSSKRNYSYTFKNVQQEKDFSLYASGFYSEKYQLKVIPNPVLRSFNVNISYPKYLNKPKEKFENIGDLIVPEGSTVNWNINTEDADLLNFMDGDSVYRIKSVNQQASFTKKVFQSSNYGFVPENKFIKQEDTVKYSLQVVKDKHPTISVAEKQDSSNQSMVYFKGEIGDDYGFSALKFYYQIITKVDSLPQRNNLKSQHLVFNRNTNIDEFFHFIDLNKLNLLPGDEISYYFEVWDNDGVNGRKATKSALKSLKTKSVDERNKETTQNNSEIKKDLSESINDAKSIQKELEELKKKMAEKKQVSWEEKEKLKNLIEKQKELQHKVNEIQKQNEQNNKQQNEYKNYNQELLKKQEQLENLFEKLMTDEMKKMMEELQKMMDKLDKNTLENELDKMELSNKDLEKELDRSLELFKQMEFELKLDEVKSKIEKMAEQQKELSEDTKNKAENNEKLTEKQEKLNSEFEKIKKELNKLTQMDKELERPNGMDDTRQEQEEISNEMEKSSEQLQNNKNKKSSESQKNAAEKMQQMAQKMASMQQQAQNNGEDMEALRQLLDNLLHLSFEQEELMESYKKMNSKSPEYVTLTQKQKKLKDDAKMIEDSLYALSKRVVQLESTINKEISLINNYMDKTIDFMAERQKPMAATSQQFVMTSINNLALLFDEALQQMQAQMRAQQKPGEGSCNKPGGNGKPKPGMAGIKKMQQQLSQQLEQMKKAMEEGNKPGKGKKPGQKKGEDGKGQGNGAGGMSESLAKMAAQQAKIREELNKLKQNGGGAGLNGMSKLMEENETDIVNKRITQKTLNRQQEILTRLLESEKAEKEREWDDKRESKEGDNNNKTNPELYFDYSLTKEQEIDLLKTTPTNMNNFYKKKVTQYFQKINQ